MVLCVRALVTKPNNLNSFKCKVRTDNRQATSDLHIYITEPHTSLYSEA